MFLFQTASVSMESQNFIGLAGTTFTTILINYGEFSSGVALKQKILLVT
jgi:hypothetical protein